MAAAIEAGAGKVVVVDNPKRRLEDHLPDGVMVAVQEQLGLRLEPAKVAVETMVIDQAEKPSEN